MPTVKRCQWCGDDPLYVAYHDEEWGVPVHEDDKLFEMLILEGAQAGLSWRTILNKRDNYRKAYDGFDPARVARYTKRKQERLLQDPGIVRNRLKVAASVKNARAVLKIQETHGSLDAFLWQYVDGEPIQNRRRGMSDIPAKTELSDALSTDLKRLGCSFVGSTICYAFMQSVGMVNDHATGCFRYREVRDLQPR